MSPSDEALAARKKATRAVAFLLKGLGERCAFLLSPRPYRMLVF